MYTLLLILFIVNAMALMLVVLMQSSKGGGLGGAFGGGGGGSQTIFGGRGAGTFLTKAAAYLGGSYFVIALLLSIVSARGRARDSMIQEELSTIANQLTNPGVPVSSALDVLSPDTVAAESIETVTGEGRQTTALWSRAEVVEHGRHAILRGWWAMPVRVQVPPSAPDTTARDSQGVPGFFTSD